VKSLETFKGTWYFYSIKMMKKHRHINLRTAELRKTWHSLPILLKRGLIMTRELCKVFVKYLDLKSKSFSKTTIYCSSGHIDVGLKGLGSVDMTLIPLTLRLVAQSFWRFQYLSQKSHIALQLAILAAGSLFTIDAQIHWHYSCNLTMNAEG